MIIFIAFVVFFHDGFGQPISIQKIKSKSDSVLAKTIGSNFKNLDPRLLEVRTTDKNDIYSYFTTKNRTVPKSKEYLITYSINFRELNYQTSLEVLYDSKFNIIDSSSLEDIPKYILNNSIRDIISKNQAIIIAKEKGLAKGDTVTAVLSSHHNDRQFYWFIRSDWKKDLLEGQKSRSRRRVVRKNDTFYINAHTKEVKTYEQLRHN